MILNKVIAVINTLNLNNPFNDEFFFFLNLKFSINTYYTYLCKTNNKGGKSLPGINTDCPLINLKNC